MVRDELHSLRVHSCFEQKLNQSSLYVNSGIMLGRSQSLPQVDELNDFVKGATPISRYEKVNNLKNRW